MINVEINSKIYNCLTNLSEMSFKRARFFLSAITKKDYESKLEALSIISNISIDLLLYFKEDDVDNIINKVYFEPIEIPKALKIKKYIYIFKNLNDLTVNEYGEIEYFLLGWKDQYEIIPQILNVLLKKVIYPHIDILYYIKKRLFIKNIIPIKIKSYKRIIENEDNSDIFDNNLDGALGLSIFYSFIEWKNKLIKEYPILWPKETEEDKNEEKVEHKSSSLDKWGMYGQICNISTSLEEREQWSKQNIHTLLKYLSWLILKNQEENKDNHGRN